MKAEGLPLMLTLEEAASFCRSNYQTLWKHVQAHKLKAHKQGGRWRVIRFDLARWTLRSSKP